MYFTLVTYLATSESVDLITGNSTDRFPAPSPSPSSSGLNEFAIKKELSTKNVDFDLRNE